MTGFTATHDGICCRCFLPDLTGFTSLRCTGPGHIPIMTITQKLLMDKSTGINPNFCRILESGNENAGPRAGCHCTEIWRREGDSNPRGSLWPPNRFRVDPVTTTSVPLRIFLLLHGRDAARSVSALYSGGESGIRTRGTPLWAYTRFPVVLLRPLRHLSAVYLTAESAFILFSLKNLLKISPHSCPNIPSVTFG